MAVGLALCIEVQGKRAPATERLMEQEIQRLQVRDLETIDATMAATFEAVTNEVGRNVFGQPPVERGMASDQANVTAITLVSAAPVRQFGQPHPDHLT